MHIDRSNYEIWFTDWMDGQLSTIQEKQLMVFLDKNPDLREELDDHMPVKAEFTGIAYGNKEQLKRQPSDISQSQFDYLCAAYLENDLDEDQKAEVEEICNSSSERLKSLDLMRRAFIQGKEIRYPHKKQILRKTNVRKVIYLSVTGIGAAAVISLFLIVYPGIRGSRNLKSGVLPVNNLAESLQEKDYPSLQKAKDATAEIASDIVNIPAKRSAPNTEKTSDSDKTAATVREAPPVAEIKRSDIPINKVPVNRSIIVAQSNPGNSLIVNDQPFIAKASGKETGEPDRSVTKLFREKLLKEKNPGESPIKGYEIAEAGVAGLNKILGWKMALGMSADENGLPKSVYFRSKLLKVQAPVKKRE